MFVRKVPIPRGLPYSYGANGAVALNSIHTRHTRV